MDEVHRRTHGRRLVFRLVIGLHRLAVDVVQLVQGVFLLVIGFQCFLAGDHLLHKAVELAQLPGPQPEQRMGLFGDAPGDEDGQGHRHQEHQHQAGLDGEHLVQRHHDGDDAGENLHQVRTEGRVDGIGVIGDAADDIAGGVGVEIAHRHIRQPGEDILPHLIGDAPGNGDHQHVQQIVHH